MDVDSIKGVIKMKIAEKTDYSYLFNNLNNNAGSSSITNLNLSDYASIKNGSYTKLLKEYYAKNKQYFKNSSELVKLRYINLVKENPKFAKIKSKFSSFTKKDRKELEQLAVQFKSYAFNDSIWVDINQVYEKIPFINLENKQKYISSGMNFQYPDSTTVWLVKVNNVLPKDSPTPLEFLKPTIKQIIINNRKLDLINTIEKEITNDAIKDNKYEIYK